VHGAWALYREFDSLPRHNNKNKNMIDFILGLKTQAIFDVWSFEHFFTGASIGVGVMLHNNKHLGKLITAIKEGIFHKKQISLLKYRYDFILLLFLAYLWETLEHYLETGLAGGWVEYWFQGIEFWPNRLIADPLMLILGYLFVKKYPKFVWPARVFIVVWLILHILVFPHSMYLHEIL